MIDGPPPAGPPLRVESGRPLAPPTRPPAGWYPDPYGQPIQRYFDGLGWTWHTAAPPGPVNQPHPTLPLPAAVGALLVLAASLAAARLLTANILRFDLPLIAYVIILAVVAYGPSLWWAWYATGRWGSGDRRADLGLQLRWSDTGWGPLVWLAAVGGQLAMGIVVTLLRIPLSGNIDDLREAELDRTYIIASAIVAVVAAPIVEEIVFRALVLRGFLSRMRWVAAVILQGVLFGAAHVGTADGAGNIGLVLVLGAVGVMLGGAAFLLRRIGPAIIGHAIFNGVVLLIVLTVDLPR